MAWQAHVKIQDFSPDRDFAVSENMAEPHLAKCDYMIKVARLKNKGHVIDMKDAVDIAEKSFERHGGKLRGTATESVDQVAIPLDSKSEEERFIVAGRGLGKLTPLAKYIKPFVNDYGYTVADKDDNMGIIKRWANTYRF